jgi:hypothetical protein
MSDTTRIRSRRVMDKEVKIHELLRIIDYKDAKIKELRAKLYNQSRNIYVQ